MRRSLLLALISTIALAQGPKAPMDEINRLRLVSAYQKAFIIQSQLQSLQEKLQEAVQNYNDVSNDVAKKMGLPDHTQFNVNLDTSQVTPVPPPAEEKKK